jgi:WD40-like Beta Propeller Repeat
MTRRQFLCRMPAAVLLAQLPLASAETRKKGVLLMNRIGPSSADLYIANADGTSERKLLQNPLFEYNACFSADGKSVLFTSERNGDGQSDIFRCRPDGAEVQPLVTGPSVDDASTVHPMERVSPSSRRAMGTEQIFGSSNCGAAICAISRVLQTCRATQAAPTDSSGLRGRLTANGSPFLPTATPTGVAMTAAKDGSIRRN